MRPARLAELRAGLLGYGREGRSTHEALKRLGAGERVVVLDDAPRPPGHEGEWLSGEAALHALRRLDVVVLSPGVPPRHPVHAAARALGLRLTNATSLAIAEAAARGVRVAAVTGSKGKSTTSTLLAESLRAAGRPSALAGNIGLAPLDVELPQGPGAVLVLETSSYQAASLTEAVDVAIVTELFPEHLDWHGSLQRYYEDKLRLAALQRPDGLTAYHGGSAELASRVPLGPARHAPYGVPGGVTLEDGWFVRAGERLFDDRDVKLPGAHNRRNACAVLTVAGELGVPDEAVRRALATFTGLPHRLEDLGLSAGRRWINDSISTAPEAAIAALEAHASSASVLIAGGHDRGYDFSPLARAVAASGIEAVIVLPPSGLQLARELRDLGWRGGLREAPDLAQAVGWAAQAAPDGSTVLFSPASPSYGAFRDFEERGARFRELVAALA